ncbi:unnamed protein product [Linum tenue]|uniref:SHSP domain-containing protein n=2 Tax=Linum tenue TaxID=586396 RepID=A0AAV0JIZ7_9ROSI|nr:unnamed protein product [Linum tenue]
MATPVRSSGKRTHNHPEANDPGHVYNVPPLNAIPLNYFNPFVANDDANAACADNNVDAGADDPPVEPANTEDPSMVFFPNGTTEAEFANILNRNRGAIALSGAAAVQKIGSGIGQMNIGESDGFYIFRISLPGVSGNDNSFSCVVDPTGMVEIHGVSTTGEQVVEKPPQVFFMETRNLCPPGPFSIKFRLPGPVLPDQLRSSFVDGMFEGIVRRNS